MMAERDPADPESTLALLWESIRRQGDMPGFAKAVGAILAAMRGEEEQQFSMTTTVLSDPVLTQKVLRLANSGMYSAYGQRISTVSQAVLVLGSEAIGQLALGLKLIEELGGSTQTASAHIEMEKAVLAGMVAQQVASCAAAREPEQAVVCAMLHTLGRMMISYYLPEHWAAMQARGAAESVETAAIAILGMSLETIGRAAANHWGLPQELVDGMRRIEPAANCSGDDWLAALSTMSSDCADSLWHDSDAGAKAASTLAGAYSAMLGVEPGAIVAAIDKARAVAAAGLSIAPLATAAGQRARMLAATRKRAEGNQLLLAGVEQMREVRASATPGQMMALALETVYKGLNLSRAVAFMRNRREQCYMARQGFGEGVVAALPALVFGDAYQADVFHAALGSDRVIFIEHAGDPKFASKLPRWWKDALSDASSFVILPLCSSGQPAGFIYGDWNGTAASGQLAQAEFGLLNEMRALVIQAVERRLEAELAASVKGA